MSIKIMSMIFDRYPAGGGEMLLALALADHAQDDGTHIFPSVKSLSKKTRQSERTIQYQIRAMEDMGWLILVADEKGGRGRAREYRINHEWIMGANIAPMFDDIKGATDDIKGATDDIKGATDDIKGATAIAPESSINIINHQEPSQENISTPSNQKTKRTRKPKITLSEFLIQCKEREEQVLPKDHSIFTYAKDAKIPDDYLYLAWTLFKRKVLPDTKKADWRQTFRNYVEFDYLKVWGIDKEGNYYLTTVGKQLEKELS